MNSTDPVQARSVRTVVHLVRHGEVDNPDHVLYARLAGFHLSEAGRVMGKAAADFLAGHDVTVLRSSPMERAQESAEPFAAEFGLPVVVDDRLIEAANRFEGLRFGVGDGALRQPRYWRYLSNPFRPSWGEPYRSVVARMMSMMETAREAAAGREAVCVTHQLPIWVTRRTAEGRRLWHNPALRECALGSVTSFTYSGDRLAGVSYTVPARRQVKKDDAAQ
jgi:broad specificity phosphatase PhoE